MGHLLGGEFGASQLWPDDLAVMREEFASRSDSTRFSKRRQSNALVVRDATGAFPARYRWGLHVSQSCHRIGTAEPLDEFDISHDPDYSE